MRPFSLVAVALCLGACSTTTSPSPSTAPAAAAEVSSSPAPQGTLPAAALQAKLLQPADLPTLTNRREFASADLTTQATPQLALCTQAAPVAPHELASVLAKPVAAGQVQVFELLSAYASASAARQAFDRAVSDTAHCSSYAVDGVPYRVVDVSRPRIAGAQAVLQYRLTTPSVVGGDVRTLGLSGSWLVLVTGYGAPPQGQDLLHYQAAVLAKAVHRL
jgi:hypothetical protein